MDSPIEQRSKAPRVWALLGARAGDNAQVLALARALGWPFDAKHLEYNLLHWLGPRLLGRSLASLTRASRKLVSGELPDLTISVGRRSVPLVQALRHSSRGRTKLVHIGFPRIAPANFDLVVTTPQYPVPDAPNVIRVPLALAGPAASASTDDDRLLSKLPSPRRLLLVGGPNIYWNIDQPALLASLGTLLDDASQGGGSVLITTSPRTPPRIKSKIADALNRADVPTLLAEPKQAPSYASLLAGSDSIHVTADSVAMVSDAIRTGKPMALIRIRKNVLGAVVMGIMDRLRPGGRVYPQDLRFFWRAVADLGITEKLARSLSLGKEQLELVATNVRSLIDLDSSR